VLDPTDPNAELQSLNQPVDEWPNLVNGNGFIHLRIGRDASSWCAPETDPLAEVPPGRTTMISDQPY
jgi:hypothetical protein